MTVEGEEVAEEEAITGTREEEEEGGRPGNRVAPATAVRTGSSRVRGSKDSRAGEDSMVGKDSRARHREANEGMTTATCPRRRSVVAGTKIMCNS